MHQIEAFPGNPACGKQDIGHNAVEALAAGPEKGKYGTGYQCIEYSCKQASAHRGLAYPPGCEQMECQKGGKVPPEKALFAGNGGKAFRAQQGHKGDERKGSEVRDEIWQAEQGNEEHQQQREQSILFHFHQAYWRNISSTSPEALSYLPEEGIRSALFFR